MTGGGEAPADNGGEFLLSLLQRPPNQAPAPPVQQQQQQALTVDPAVAAIGPTITFLPPYGHDHCWPHANANANANAIWHGHNYPGYLSPGFPQGHNPFPPAGLPVDAFPANPIPAAAGDVDMGAPRGEALRGLGFPVGPSAAGGIDAFVEHKLKFGSLPSDAFRREASVSHNGDSGGNPHHLHHHHPHDHHGGNYRPPPSPFSNKPRARPSWDSASTTSTRAAHSVAFSGQRQNVGTQSGRVRVGQLSSEKGTTSSEVGLVDHLFLPGPPSGTILHSLPTSHIEEVTNHFDTKIVLHNVAHQNHHGGAPSNHHILHSPTAFGEHLVESLLNEDDSEHQNASASTQHRTRDKDFRSDSRGQRLLSQRARMYKRQMNCRSDINSFNLPLLTLYESLKPPEEEKAKQKQLLTLLENLVNKEWPKAHLYLYGSCANSFGVCKSDIDVCLAIEETDLDKSEIILKLADILKSDNLQNVQALTRARVPIVKLMDPVTGISCDICVNNLLAVVNTKLLRDYAKIDERLRQLAFIIKHWAKSRGVNETYQGTLSSYAYVLMCIHFLQMRRPAILPCLQEMETTYSVNVDDIKCGYFDEVEKLRDFGRHNKETIAQLVWGFFFYWAYCHDYASSVISVRTGSIISKREKDWTRRIGNDRHLICIEDPFELSHDLGRVVDKSSIKVLREEFERAADILQYDSNPCVKLFEPYVPTPK